MSCVFIVSAPSGSGKSTLVGELFRRVEGLRFSISYTTRAPRGSERDGQEYFFIDRAGFEGMIAAGAFLEYAEVFGNYYGTAWSYLEEAQRQGHDLVLDIDVQGAGQVRRRLSAAVSIFIAPPDRETLARRLRNRGLDAPAVVETRLADASREIGAYNNYDYVVINDRLEESVERLCAVVRYERAGPEAEDSDRRLALDCRRERAAPRLRPVLESFGLTEKEESR